MSNVNISVQDNIAFVTLQKEPLNICDRFFYAEIIEAMKELDKRNDFRVVVLKSGCRHFCGGGDLNEINDILTKGGEFAETASKACADAMESIICCKKPVIAAVNGNAIGAGTALAVSCDIIITEERTKFAVPEITVGFIGASEFMEMLIPKRLARYYVFTGKPISAEIVKSFGGILDTAKDQTELTEKVIAVAKDICNQAPEAVTLFKRALNENSADNPKEKYLNEMRLGIEKFYTSKDAVELANALKEKRAPNFTGE